MTFYRGGKMNRKRKIGISLILIGLAIPIVLFFFQEDGVIYSYQIYKTVERKLSPEESFTFRELAKKDLKIEEHFDLIKNGKHDAYWEQKKAIQDFFEKNHFEKVAWTVNTRRTISIPFRQIVGIGVALIFFGFGIFIFSFSPKDKPKKAGAEE